MTTHYIEEARNSDCVALMINGMVIEEASPQLIMQRNNCNSLEDAFYNICNRRVFDKNDNAKETIQTNAISKRITNFKRKFRGISLKRIQLLAHKNMKLIFKRKLFFFIYIIIPTISTLLSYFFGKDIRSIDIAVIDNDNANVSQLILKPINNYSRVEVHF